MKKIALLLVVTLMFSCKSKGQDKDEKESFSVSKTDSQWKAELTDMEYYVLREAGTERAFSSPLNNEYRSGTFHCAACNTPLFKSENKFDSGTGWPSFDQEIKGNVAFSTDYDLGYARTEEHCATCGGHLGHVFNDGPEGMPRYCINATVLEFVPRNGV